MNNRKNALIIYARACFVDVFKRATGIRNFLRNNFALLLRDGKTVRLITFAAVMDRA